MNMIKVIKAKDEFYPSVLDVMSVEDFIKKFENEELDYEFNGKIYLDSCNIVVYGNNDSFVSELALDYELDMNSPEETYDNHSSSIYYRMTSGYYEYIKIKSLKIIKLDDKKVDYNISPNSKFAKNLEHIIYEDENLNYWEDSYEGD